MRHTNALIIDLNKLTAHKQTNFEVGSYNQRWQMGYTNDLSVEFIELTNQKPTDSFTTTTNSTVWTN